MGDVSLIQKGSLLVVIVLSLYIICRRKKLHEKIKVHKPFEDYLKSVADEWSKSYGEGSTTVYIDKLA